MTRSVLWRRHVIEIHINRLPVNELAIKRNGSISEPFERNLIGRLIKM